MENSTTTTTANSTTIAASATAISQRDAAKLTVNLIASTPNAKAITFTAIRRCYSGLDGDKLFVEAKNKVDSDKGRLFNLVYNENHLSTFEHILFTFTIDGLSRAALAQLTRHRIGFSYSVQSQRYVRNTTSSKNGGFKFSVPDLDAEKQSIISATNKVCQEAYDKLVELGAKPEDARSVIPQDATTSLVLSCNLRALLDFCGKRTKAKGAQSEISALSDEMMRLVIEKEPWIGELGRG